VKPVRTFPTIPRGTRVSRTLEARLKRLDKAGNWKPLSEYREQQRIWPCYRCHHWFRWVFWQSKFCSDCHVIQTRETRQRLKAEERERRSDRRAEARQGLHCLACGKLLDAKRTTRRYCNSTCRVTQWRNANGGGARGAGR